LKNPRCHVTPETERKIKKLKRKENLTLAQLAERFGTTTSFIDWILQKEKRQDMAKAIRAKKNKKSNI
jgi:transcriptional regulator with XRE-family HTH domain